MTAMTTAARGAACVVCGAKLQANTTGRPRLPSWNGRPYTDGATRVMADNVLVLATKAVPDSYKDPAGNPVYKTVSTGSGKLSLYRNGKQISGTWSRTATDKPFVLRDVSGNQLQLAPGKTWILLQN